MVRRFADSIFCGRIVATFEPGRESKYCVDAAPGTSTVFVTLLGYPALVLVVVF